MLRIFRHDYPHSALPDIDSKPDWVNRLTKVNLGVIEANRQTSKSLSLSK